MVETRLQEWGSRAGRACFTSWGWGLQPPGPRFLGRAAHPLPNCQRGHSVP